MFDVEMMGFYLFLHGTFFLYFFFTLPLMLLSNLIVADEHKYMHMERQWHSETASVL
jgi:hypothetical protein